MKITITPKDDTKSPKFTYPCLVRLGDDNTIVLLTGKGSSPIHHQGYMVKGNGEPFAYSSNDWCEHGLEPFHGKIEIEVD